MTKLRAPSLMQTGHFVSQQIFYSAKPESVNRSPSEFQNADVTSVCGLPTGQLTLYSLATRRELFRSCLP